MMDFLQHLDERILLAVNGWNSPFFDSFMWWVSGKTSWLPLYLALIILLFFVKKWKEALLILGFAILLVVLSDQGSVHLFKNVFQRPRPSHNPGLDGLIHLVNSYRGGKFGFVSSHAANCFAVAVFLSLCLKRTWFTILMVTWAVLVSYSRIYLGVHYFFDVLGGALFGILLAAVIYRLYKWTAGRVMTEK